MEWSQSDCSHSARSPGVVWVGSAEMESATIGSSSNCYQTTAQTEATPPIGYLPTLGAE